MKLGELANDDRSTVCQERYGTKYNDGAPDGPVVSLTVKSITGSQRIKCCVHEIVLVPRWPFYNDYGFPKKELWKALTMHVIYRIALVEAPNTMPQSHQKIDVPHLQIASNAAPRCSGQAPF